MKNEKKQTMKEKLSSIKVESKFKRLDVNELSKLIAVQGGRTGGTSCGATSSTCGCDATCVCGC